MAYAGPAGACGEAGMTEAVLRAGSCDSDIAFRPCTCAPFHVHLTNADLLRLEGSGLRRGNGERLAKKKGNRECV
jgi:hypothetical protein